MKRLSFIIYLLSFIFSATPATARLPIIIDSAILSHPLDTEDQNYLPSDPEKVDTVKHIQTITIEETFHLIQAGTDASGSPVYQHQDINQIDQKLEIGQYTNNGLNYFNAHTAKRFSNPLADPEDLSVEFRSYGASNLSRRTLPAFLQKCLIGQRLVAAYRTLTGNFTGTTVDIVIHQNPTVRISEVSFFFRQQPIFYDPEEKCPATATDGSPLSAFVPSLPPVSTPLNLDTYQKLYLYGIEPVDDNSLGTIVEQCDLNSSGQPVNCKKEIRSLPLGSGPASRAGRFVSSYYTPASAKKISRDYSQTSPDTPISDQPNPISFLAAFFKNFFSGNLNETKTFTGPTQITHQIDARLEKGLEIDETATRHLLPNSVNKQTNSSASTTNGSTLDPGKNNAEIRTKLLHQLYPSSWQQ